MTRYSTLTGRTIFITGAGSGIGAATARALAAAGAGVALVDLRAPEDLATELGSRAVALAGDVTSASDMEAAVAATVAHFGGVDVCFANAGIAAASPTTIRNTSVEEFERIIEVDLLGVWRTVRACLPHIIESKGHVLVTASIYAFFNGVVNAPYAMSKAGVESFGRALRGELAGTGATAGVLYPGWIATPIIEASHQAGTPADELVKLANPGPLGRTITPERLAEDIVRGIQNRRARIISPRRWIPISMARGPFNMAIDAVLDRHKRAQGLIRQIDQ
jgi:NAD(P)-dependent dehydrogenase (short-subunit alcohol dehydrogenase family)